MKNNVCIVLGNNIKRIRKSKGLKQDELAELIGLEVKSLSLIETGNGFASAKTLEKLITVLNISLNELFAVNDKKEAEAIYTQIIQNLSFMKDDNEKLNTVLRVVKSLM